MSLQAILFDLYGTLLRVDRRAIHRELPALLGVPRQRWLRLVKEELLTTSFPDLPSFARRVCDAFVPAHGAALEARCVEIVERELATVELVPGALSLLHFLKRRGFKLGLLSNLSSVYREPLARFGLAELFDAVAFSCDEGRKKPDPVIYLDLCARLGVEPGAALFVGDSEANDVVAPADLGMRTVRIAPGAGVSSRADAVVEEVGGVGWLALAEGHEVAPLLGAGARARLGRSLHTLGALRPVPDGEQGRYNLVYSTEGVDQLDRREEVFVKRFLLPESAYLEEFAHAVHREIGLPSCRARVEPGAATGEPCLLVSRAPGRKYDGEMSETIAWELGRHHVFAYLFSNADMRPRNAFLRVTGDGAEVAVEDQLAGERVARDREARVAREWGARDWVVARRPPAGSLPEPAATVTMIDLEHCFFNLAIDTAGLADPFRPQSLDRLPAAELERRVAKRVLSPRAMRRARGTFIDTAAVPPATLASFRAGFLDFFAELAARREEVCSWLAERVSREPYLIIGTQSYRRAMARVDVDDVDQRLAGNAVAALDSFC